MSPNPGTGLCPNSSAPLLPFQKQSCRWKQCFQDVPSADLSPRAAACGHNHIGTSWGLARACCCSAVLGAHPGLPCSSSLAVSPDGFMPFAPCPSATGNTPINTRKSSVSRQGRVPGSLQKHGMGSSQLTWCLGAGGLGGPGSLHWVTSSPRDLRRGKCSLVALLLSVFRAGKAAVTLPGPCGPWSPRGCCQLGHTPESTQLTARQRTCLESSARTAGLPLGAQDPQQPDTCPTWQGCFGSDLPMQAGVGEEGATPREEPRAVSAEAAAGWKAPSPQSPHSRLVCSPWGGSSPLPPALTFCNLSGNW